jgi:RNA polymerase sigma-70 factor (ECF subfamily)
MSERVRAAVRALPARYREVVVLRYLEELPIAEIGQLLDLKPNTVEVRLTRARAALRTALADLMDTSQ